MLLLCAARCVVLLLLLLLLFVFLARAKTEKLFDMQNARKKTKAARRPTRTHAHTAIMKRQKRQKQEEKNDWSSGSRSCGRMTMPDIWHIFIYISLYISLYLGNMHLALIVPDTCDGLTFFVLSCFRFCQGLKLLARGFPYF